MLAIEDACGQAVDIYDLWLLLTFKFSKPEP